MGAGKDYFVLTVNDKIWFGYQLYPGFHYLYLFGKEIRWKRRGENEK